MVIYTICGEMTQFLRNCVYACYGIIDEYERYIYVPFDQIELFCTILMFH